MSVMLVPLDFSDVTSRVIGVATQMAKATCESPLLLHVTPPEPPYIGYEPVPASTPFAAEVDPEVDRLQLDHWRDRITGLNSNVSTLQMQGPPTEQILAAAEERHARMIVMGTHRHTALHDVLLGNVTHGVLHHARCPVTVVPAARPHLIPTTDDRLIPGTTQIDSILTLVDFSDLTEAVIRQTELLARAFDSRVTILHVIPPDPLVIDFAPPPGTETEAEAYQADLNRLRKQLESAGLEAVTREETGPVLEIVRRKVDELAPDLIIMGSHGHGALYNLFVGSVTAGLLHHATCPVVVVPRASYEEFRVKLAS
ncbi:universal stress protein [Verrucomicrobium sp. BvORR106]|uniref:universal stress protein n=1 Tax=Verrucomicrobium sp. BvORR106 TaxID=1403819 RepID=UPI00068DC3E2|nr:universal stress protein [Verrucomicrobium sp. BvORR106]